MCDSDGGSENAEDGEEPVRGKTEAIFFDSKIGGGLVGEGGWTISIVFGRWLLFHLVAIGCQFSLVVIFSTSFSIFFFEEIHSLYSTREGSFSVPLNSSASLMLHVHTSTLFFFFPFFFSQSLRIIFEKAKIRLSDHLVGFQIIG